LAPNQKPRELERLLNMVTYFSKLIQSPVKD